MGNMDDFSLSDLAGSTAIILASCGALVSVFLSSRCECAMSLCGCFTCSRTAPPIDGEEIKKKDKDKGKDKGKGKDKDKDKDKDIEDPDINRDDESDEELIPYDDKEKDKEKLIPEKKPDNNIIDGETD